MTNLILIGFRGVGKTTLGTCLAKELDLPFHDVDHIIEQNEDTSIQDIFSVRGEASFREVEVNAIEQLQGKSNAIISVGGGALLNHQNQKIISELGSVVWLTAPISVLTTRLAGSDRPMLTDLPLEEEVATLYGLRHPIYQRLADKQVDTSQTIIEVLSELKSIWNQL
jgi:shikimate kinase